MRMVWALCALAALAASPAVGQSMLDACKADIETFCAAVEPGDGRIAACLYAHENALSQECDAATGDLADIIDVFFSVLADVQAACSADATELCSDVGIGGGRLYTCLRENSARTSDECTAELDKISLPSE